MSAMRILLFKQDEECVGPHPSRPDEPEVSPDVYRLHYWILTTIAQPQPHPATLILFSIMRPSTLLPVLLAVVMSAVASPTPLENAAVQARQICYQQGEDCSDYMYPCCPCLYCYTDPQLGTSVSASPLTSSRYSHPFQQSCAWNIWSSGCD